MDPSLLFSVIVEIDSTLRLETNRGKGQQKSQEKGETTRKIIDTTGWRDLFFSTLRCRTSSYTSL